MLKFGRCKVGLLVQWISGFCNLMRHKHLKTPSLNPECRRCGNGEETPHHLTSSCPSLFQARLNNFLTWENEKITWTPDKLYKFIVESKSEELLIDREEYLRD